MVTLRRNASKIKSEVKGAHDNIASIFSGALRQLVFWVGYKHEKYYGHPLIEGAIVGELRDLISAQVSQKYSLECEVPYREFSGKDALTVKGRPEQADFALWDKKTKRIVAIVELKKGKAITKKVVEDLRKLQQVKSARLFLILVTESGVPTSLISATGRARRKIDPKDGIRFQVRSVCSAGTTYRSTSIGKSGFTFNTKAKGQHFAVLIEVYTSKNDPS